MNFPIDGLSIALFTCELADCIFGGSDSAGYSLRGNIRRYDGAGGKLSEIGVQGEGLSKTENHMVSALWFGHVAHIATSHRNFNSDLSPAGVVKMAERLLHGMDPMARPKVNPICFESHEA